MVITTTKSAASDNKVVKLSCQIDNRLCLTMRAPHLIEIMINFRKQAGGSNNDSTKQ